jgi:hypothetical protein
MDPGLSAQPNEVKDIERSEDIDRGLNSVETEGLTRRSEERSSDEVLRIFYLRGLRGNISKAGQDSILRFLDNLVRELKNLTK